MLAIKAIPENYEKISERCPYLTFEVLKDHEKLIDDVGIFYAVHNYVGKFDQKNVGDVLITEGHLKKHFNSEPSDTEWFDISRK